MSRAEAVTELEAGSGVVFDPEVVDALLDLLGERRPHVRDRSRGVRLPTAPKEPQGRRRRRR